MLLLHKICLVPLELLIIAHMNSLLILVASQRADRPVLESHRLDRRARIGLLGLYGGGGGIGRQHER